MDRQLSCSYAIPCSAVKTKGRDTQPVIAGLSCWQPTMLAPGWQCRHPWHTANKITSKWQPTLLANS